MTEIKDEENINTPGKEAVPRGRSEKDSPPRNQPPPPPKTTFQPALPKFGNVTEIAKDTGSMIPRMLETESKSLSNDELMLFFYLKDTSTGTVVTTTWWPILEHLLQRHQPQYVGVDVVDHSIKVC